MRTGSDRNRLASADSNALFKTDCLKRNLSLIIHTEDRPGQLMHISACLEDLQLKTRGLKVKADEDELPAGKDAGTLYIELEVYNHRGVKSVIVVDAIKRIDGVLSVDIT